MTNSTKRGAVVEAGSALETAQAETLKPRRVMQRCDHCGLLLAMNEGQTTCSICVRESAPPDARVAQEATVLERPYGAELVDEKHEGSEADLDEVGPGRDRHARLVGASRGELRACDVCGRSTPALNAKGQCVRCEWQGR